MMKRRIEKKLIQWQKRENRKPLLLQGARQVGKTYVLENFGENRFNTSHYFDLEELKADLSPIFTDSSLKPRQLLNQLSFISGKPFNISEDILILDEIQSIPRAITALKYFNQQMRELAVVAAGSNLGVAHANEPFPVGKVDIFHMYPMNFEEFLLGTGEDMALSFLKSFKGNKTNEMYHKHLFDLLKVYFITGGMPEVIVQYNDKKDEPLEALRAVRRLQKQLLLHYEFCRFKKTEQHAAQAPAPPACKPTGSLRAGSAARANLPFEIRFGCFRQAQALSLPKGDRRRLRSLDHVFSVIRLF